MGGSFYSGWLIPRETSLVIWGIERKRIKRFKAQKVKVGFSLHRLPPRKIVKMKVFHRIGTCLRDKATIKLKYATMVTTS
jgi:hypothetical protein